MAHPDPLETLRVEASCSVCLEFLQDPVLIECGHNFCRRCITRWWAGLAGAFPCPVCRKSARRRRLRPNRQLGNMVEAARLLRAAKRRAAPREHGSCPQHGRPLRKFCAEHDAAMCAQCEVQCARSQHHVRGVEEAALEWKEKLQRCLAPLEQRLLALRRCRSQEETKPAQLKRTVSAHRQRISQEFEELHRLLDEEERELQRRLEEEEREILQRLRANMELLQQRSARLEEMLASAEEKSVQGGVQLLQGISAFLSRCEEEAAAAEPPPVPIALQRNFRSFPRQYFTLRKIARRLLGEMTLDPSTAHPNLQLSPDLKSVRFVDSRQRDLPANPRRFTGYPCVLGARGFTSGRHYWEVEVGDKTHWALGVCRDSVCRRGEAPALPQSGFWRVRLWNGDRYAATTAPFTPLRPRVRPTRVGVFVDYEAGEVAFYNVTDRSHLYTFTDTFTEKIWPLFYPGIRAGRRNAAPLVICEPTDWE